MRIANATSFWGWQKGEKIPLVSLGPNKKKLEIWQRKWQFRLDEERLLGEKLMNKW